jgi:hypothetical protein
VDIGGWLFALVLMLHLVAAQQPDCRAADIDATVPSGRGNGHGDVVVYEKLFEQYTARVASPGILLQHAQPVSQLHGSIRVDPTRLIC